MTEPTILKAASSADFLAALPRLTGMTAPESLFLVLFDGNRTLGAARLDLPERLAVQLECPSEEIAVWLRAASEIALRGDGAAVVVQTAGELSQRPAASPHGTLAAVLADVLQSVGARLVDVLVVGSDGWASWADTDQPGLRALDEITSSPLHDPEHVALGVDDWRAQNPGRTAESAEEINELADRMAAGSDAQRREA